MITPLDIENKKFSKQVMNGYNVEEVDDFLDDLTVDYTKNYKETTELKAKVEELNKSLEHYKSIEATLQDTLVIAQKTAEDVICYAALLAATGRSAYNGAERS